jgi:multidrug resistance efflux pump
MRVSLNFTRVYAFHRVLFLKCSFATSRLLLCAKLSAMTQGNRNTNSYDSTGRFLLVFVRAISWIILLLITGTACHSVKDNNETESNIIVINAPANGRVKRIVTPEGVHVSQGTPVIEIAVRSNAAATTTNPAESREAQAIRDYKAADAEIEAARAEAVRHGGEVERLTPLVASGEASQGQLDGERALYENAQRRLQQAQEAKRNAEGGLLAARQPGLNRGNLVSPGPGEQVVSALATSAGTVAIISARVGDEVKVGQPLATVRADR